MSNGSGYENHYEHFHSCITGIAVTVCDVLGRTSLQTLLKFLQTVTRSTMQSSRVNALFGLIKSQHSLSNS